MTEIEVVRADITLLSVDTIVNAANNSLLGGGGVDGAIHHAAGPGLLQECEAISGCPTGEARITKGYNLPARHVIHTVGPVWQNGNCNEAKLLASCYRNCFSLLKKHRLSSIAFPAISCGIYGYPPQAACTIAINETKTFLQKSDSSDTKVIFVPFNDTIEQEMRRHLS